ncbi:MAG: diguanylate cyclase [Aquificaceae bacterium]|nr:diguanylate cyclase [Aquificaceae bacterium]
MHRAMDYSALDLIPEPILVVDQEYKLVFANRRAKEVYGEGPQNCYGLSHPSEMHCHEIKKHFCPVNNLREQEVERSGVIHVHRTLQGDKYFYVVIGYDPKRNLYAEVHIDLFELVRVLKVSGQRTEFLLSSGPVVFFQCKKEKGLPVEFISQNVAELLGYTAEDFLSGRVSYGELVHPEEVERFKGEVMYHTENKSPFWTHQDYRLRRKDGVYIWVYDHKIPLLEDGGEVVGYYGYIMDITEKHEQEELFHVLAESNPYAVLLYDFKDNRIIYVNGNATRLFGCSKEELLAISDPTSLVYPADRRRVLENIAKRKEGYDGLISYKMRVITRGGGTKWVKLTSVVTHYKGKRVSVITLVDISRDIKREKQLTRLATRDKLTGAFNRHALLHDFERLIAQCRRYDTYFSLIMFDIDNFKAFNDTYGHFVGDRVLKETVRVAKRTLRKSDIFGRWGGEEFLVLLPMTPEPYAPAEKIRRKIEAYGHRHNLKITVSLGATVYRKGDTIHSMLLRVDEALYRAKAEGKNRVVVL